MKKSCTVLKWGGYKTLRKRNVKGRAKGLLDIIVCLCTLDSYLLGVTKHLTIALK